MKILLEMLINRENFDNIWIVNSDNFFKRTKEILEK